MMLVRAMGAGRRAPRLLFVLPLFAAALAALAQSPVPAAPAAPAAPPKPQFSPPSTAIPCALGEIIAAEIGNGPLGASVDGLPGDPNAAGEGKSKAVVVVQLYPRASLSVYDFSLATSPVRKHPCAAIRVGDGNYSSKGMSWQVPSQPAAAARCSLLFFVDPTVQEKPEFELQWTLPGSRLNLPPVRIPFRNLGDAPFTPPQNIPKEGQIGVGGGS